MTLCEAAVLIVDDEPELRDIFSRIISRAGCPTIFTAKDGLSAIVVMLANRIDCLITDIRMPGMDGVTLVRRLAEIGKMPPGIVFVSGFSDVDQREMYGLGVGAFLLKPLLPKNFLADVEQALAARGELWLTPMAEPPVQSISLTLERDRTKSFCLGRGGFSAHCSEPLAMGKITFRCSFSDRSDELSGEGYVRWRSSSEESVGIEVFFLDQPGRNWFVQEIETTLPQSFIPSTCAKAQRGDASGA
jgi:CheY-like chemotaxis protein